MRHSNTPSFTVVIPWRPTPSRIPPMRLLLDWYRTNLDLEPVLLDTTDEVFNVASVRNAATEVAETTVVVINDADTIPQRDQLLLAIQRAAYERRAVMPFSLYLSLWPHETERVLETGSFEHVTGWPVTGHVGGITAVRPDAWWRGGGQDERFRGWGFEDTAWEIAHSTMVQPVGTVEGRAIALGHQPQVKEGPQYDDNIRLWMRYDQARGDRVAMQSLIDEALEHRANNPHHPVRRQPE